MASFLGFPLGDNSKIDIQRFGPDFNNGSRVGSNTWVRPTVFVPKYIVVYLCGAGAGGGSGRKHTAGGTAVGGPGGCAGELITTNVLDVRSLPNSVIITIGAGGNGGSSQTTNSTNGNIGSDGAASTFGSYITARSGTASATAANATAVAGTTVAASVNAPGSSGTSGASTQGSTGGSSTLSTCGAGVPGYIAPMGGGGGAGFTTSSTGNNGGDGKPSTIGIFSVPASRAGLTASTVDGLDAASIGSGTLIPFYTGGGGGASFATGNAGNGGKGKFGSGGGGGGASRDSQGNSGAGGKGGDGFCIVVTYG